MYFSSAICYFFNSNMSLFRFKKRLFFHSSTYFSGPFKSFGVKSCSFSGQLYLYLKINTPFDPPHQSRLASQNSKFRHKGCVPISGQSRPAFQNPKHPPNNTPTPPPPFTCRGPMRSSVSMKPTAVFGPPDDLPVILALSFERVLIPARGDALRMPNSSSVRPSRSLRENLGCSHFCGRRFGSFRVSVGFVSFVGCWFVFCCWFCLVLFCLDR